MEIIRCSLDDEVKVRLIDDSLTGNEIIDRLFCRVPLPYGHASSMIPMRRQSIRCHFVKGVDWCSWKLIAMILLMVSLCITAALAYVVGKSWHPLILYSTRVYLG